jgi:hypothetical protein
MGIELEFIIIMAAFTRVYIIICMRNTVHVNESVKAGHTFELHHTLGRRRWF